MLHREIKCRRLGPNIREIFGLTDMCMLVQFNMSFSHRKFVLDFADVTKRENK